MFTPVVSHVHVLGGGDFSKSLLIVFCLLLGEIFIVFDFLFLFGGYEALFVN